MDVPDRRFFRYLLIFTVIFGVFLVTAGKGRAQGGACLIAITKIADGGQGRIFDFQVQVGDVTGSARFVGGETHVGNFGGGEPVAITELPNPGWVLTDKFCETGLGPLTRRSGASGGSGSESPLTRSCPQLCRGEGMNLI